MSIKIQLAAAIEANADTVLPISATGCTTCFVAVPPTSSYGVIVHIEGLHDFNVFDVIYPGQERVFRYGDAAITTVIARGFNGTATNVTYGVVSKTRTT